MRTIGPIGGPGRARVGGARCGGGVRLARHRRRRGIRRLRGAAACAVAQVPSDHARQGAQARAAGGRHTVRLRRAGPGGAAHPIGWKSAQYRRTGRRDRFAQRWISALVRRLHESRADGCSGVLSVLYAGRRPVAAHFGSRSRTVLSCWFPAYETEFATYSPGLVLHLRMAEAAAREGIGMVDLGRGDAEYKDALKTGELRVHEGAALRPGARAALPKSHVIPPTCPWSMWTNQNCPINNVEGPIP
ncbi:GNAT family N-acetyltransferase [Streptomyces sp. NPDC096176]|uniref:GNAT family N-acetyltransferase n=1 Tax=Streptomyces sp. NPDC096176 TaxID=3366079 RepID=UPI00381326A5